MFIDKELEFSSAQAVTASAASENVIDNSEARDIGMSDLYAHITVDESVTAAGSATVEFVLQKDSAENFSSAEDVMSTGAFAKADLVAGKQIFIKIPFHADKRYLRMNYVVASGPVTAGAFTAAIITGVQKADLYPDGL